MINILRGVFEKFVILQVLVEIGDIDIFLTHVIVPFTLMLLDYADVCVLCVSSHSVWIVLCVVLLHKRVVNWVFDHNYFLHGLRAMRLLHRLKPRSDLLLAL